ncbi:MAG: peptidoglycan editing factor PgeF [Bacteroidota bacterium]|nr:peptidoglycan editing factor PgeF [Bacteroidota bacterium]MDP3143983.1 peptidoglycan editing factor PgeF [Bacteroidota bacterium]
MWLSAPNIDCIHGFSNRHGGISVSPFDSLNLGGSEDEPIKIATNRKLALKNLNLSIDKLCNLKQIHSNKVCIAKIGQQEGDALVTNEKNLILAISIADCYPILFHDKVNNVIGAAHAGWRGTVSKIAENTINEMIKLGAQAENIKVAIGQGISQDKFEVGNEVIEQFEKAGFPSYCWKENKINLIACNKFVLFQNGILEQNCWTMNSCTFENDFFSYRRDKGKTGRMWAMINMG